MKDGGCDKTQEMNDAWDQSIRELWAEEEAKASQEQVTYIVGEQIQLPL